MKIESTGVTYQRIPARPATGEAAANAQNEAVMKNAVEQAGTQQKPVEQPVDTARPAAHLDIPLSEHLSLDERDMIQRLFPAPGRAFGVQQYRKINAEPRANSGIAIDIKG